MNTLMNEFDIAVVNDYNVDFMPDSYEREILQNVLTICTTIKGSVPLDRDLGVSAMIIDEPVNVAKARITSEIIEAVRKYEPRVRVTEVSFEGSMNEKITPHVKIRMLI